MVLDGGACKSGIESTIIGFENDEPIIYRLGSTSIEAIETVVGKIKIKNSTAKLTLSQKEVAPNAPGMLERHYAPKTRTILTNDILNAITKHKDKRIGLLLFNDINNDSITFKVLLSKNKNLEEAAASLYDALHQLDNEDLDIIITEKLPNHGLGKSINDRLERATK